MAAVVWVIFMIPNPSGIYGEPEITGFPIFDREITLENSPWKSCGCRTCGGKLGIGIERKRITGKSLDSAASWIPNKTAAKNLVGVAGSRRHCPGLPDGIVPR
jgi:hypothetical protein